MMENYNFFCFFSTNKTGVILLNDKWINNPLLKTFCRPPAKSACGFRAKEGFF